MHSESAVDRTFWAEIDVFDMKEVDAFFYFCAQPLSWCQTFSCWKEHVGGRSDEEAGGGWTWGGCSGPTWGRFITGGHMQGNVHCLCCSPQWLQGACRCLLSVFVLGGEPPPPPMFTFTLSSQCKPFVQLCASPFHSLVVMFWRNQLL